MTAGLAHDVMLATVRDFTDRTGARRVVVILDLGDATDPPVIECEPGEPIAISAGEEDVIVMPADFAGAEPILLEVPKAIPETAIEADAETGQVSAPIGALDAFAEALTAFAGALGGRTLAVADLGTRSGATLTVAARPGEPVIVAIGEQQFELGTHP
ncbi:MAG: hypothetical protein QOF76_2372 [Solirubrobacteraceae bacterium]|nr:hypothetical protein [Solirubrobacteraceae bacterium]